jgi:vitamin B12 transporter
MRANLATAVVASIISISTCLAAEEDKQNNELEEQELVITSSRLPQPPASSSTTLDEERIESQRSANVLDLLSQAPGVFATQPGRAGGVSEVFLRGAESNFATVLVDGVRVSDPSNTRGGGYDFSTLNPDEIQRIEIVRGSLSAIHGSDAMSGVINILTRRPTSDFEAQARGEGGTHGYGRAFGSLSGPLSDSARAGLKAGYADLGEAVQGFTQRLATVQADIDVTASPMTNLRAGLRFADRERANFPDASGGPIFAATRELEQASATETTAWTHLHRTMNSAWQIDTFGAFHVREEEVSTPAITAGVFDGVPASSSDTRFHRAQLTINNAFALDPALELGGGVDLQFEDGRRDGFIDFGFMQLPSRFDSHRFTGAAYTEAKYIPVRGTELYGAARAEADEDGKFRSSGRFSIQRQTDPSAILLRASFASGYKRPSFYALGDTLVGNPDLNMETSTTLELSAEKSFAGGLWTMGATAFRSRYANLIDFDFTTFRLVNRSQTRIEGVELAATIHPLQTLSIDLHGTFSHIELPGEEDTLLYRPESYGGIRVDWRPNTLWTLQAHTQLAGGRWGSSVPTGLRRMSSYNRVDLSLSRKMSARMILFAALDNVLDETYSQAVGFPDPGFQARAGAALKF